MLDYLMKKLIFVVGGFQQQLDISFYLKEDMAMSKYNYLDSLGIPVIMFTRYILKEESHKVYFVCLLTDMGGGDENIFVTTSERDAIYTRDELIKTYGGYIKASIKSFTTHELPPMVKPIPIKNIKTRTYLMKKTEKI